MYYLTTSVSMFPLELISTVNHCFMIHLRENRIKLVEGILAWHITIGGDARFVILLLVPKDLVRLIFDAYYSGGISGHLCVIKTLTVLRLRFIWPSMRKETTTWVK